MTQDVNNVGDDRDHHPALGRVDGSLGGDPPKESVARQQLARSLRDRGGADEELEITS